MAQESVLKIYHSSAGSGKTYNLAREYLKLALDKPGNFRHILAVTFTNKATNEMKSRITTELFRLATADPDSSMMDDLSSLLHLSKLQVQERGRMALHSVLHDYSHFAVTTIDSFFQKVIQGFSREIGLQGGYEVELDTEKVLKEITELVFLDLENDHKLLGWLLQFSLAKMEEEKGWDIGKEVFSLGKEIFRESYGRMEEKLRSLATDERLFEKLRENLSGIKFSFENHMKKMAEEAIRIMANHGYEAADFKYGKSGPAAYFSKITNAKKYEYGVRVAGALKSSEAWVANHAPGRDEMISFAGKELLPRLREITSYYDRCKTTYYSANEFYRFLYAFGLLTNLAGKLGRYRDEHGAILISDLSKFLKEIIGNNDAPFIYEKAGIFYDHFLIDEFQDTSTVQWNNFSSLMKNSLAQGRMNLLVGDIKQSIYRWRGGDWRILDHGVEQNIGSEYIEKYNLNRNWRSRENIIRFNNLFFNKAVTALSDLLDDELAGENVRDHINTTFFRKAYSDITQEIPENKKDTGGGYIDIRFISRVEEVDEGGIANFRSVALKRLPSIFEEVQDRGFGPGDIAILVRNNSEGREVARYMLEFAGSPAAKKGYSYEVISSESLVLGASTSVNLLISAMKIIHDPSDDLARLNLAYHYIIINNGFSRENIHQTFMTVAPERETDRITDKIFPQEFIDNLPLYPGMPLNELVAKLIIDLKINSLTGELPYLLGFQDAIMEFSAQYRSDLSSFTEWWLDEGSGRSITLPENEHAARILTIHKAKGLEFRVTVIPFCTWKFDLDARKDNILWMDANKTLPEFDIPLPVKYSAILANTHYTSEYYLEKLMSFIDNLNLLYVALTRASDALIVMAPEQKNDKSIIPDQADKLLYHVLSGIRQEKTVEEAESLSRCWDPENQTFVSGVFPTSGKSKTAGKECGIGAFTGTDWQSRISFRKTSEKIFNPVKPSELSGLNRGVVIHEILSGIVRKEDIDWALRKAIMNGLVIRSQTAEIREMIMRLFEDPLIADWFSGTWKVKTEVPVIPAPGELNRMDRVMFRDNSAVVVDYKTGRPGRTDRGQVERYMSILKDMGYSDVRGYLLYVDESRLESV